MTYEQLRVLQAILTAGTFRGAAEKLHKSQPAISAMIKNLEQECGITLISRDQYRPVLTPEGQMFYEKAVLALRQMNQLSSLAKRLAKHEEPLVQIAINAVCPLPVLLGTLKKIDEAHPATQLNLSTEHMGGAMEKLAEGSVDIVLTTQTDMQPSFMEAIPFMAVRIIPVAHHSYEPAKHGAVFAADDMRQYVQVIVADSSHSQRKQTLDVLPEVKHWIVTDFAAKKDIIMAGMGWGGLPEYQIQDELATGELVHIHVEGFEVRHSQLYLIRRTDKTIGVVAEALWQALQDLSKKLETTITWQQAVNR